MNTGWMRAAISIVAACSGAKLQTTSPSAEVPSEPIAAPTVEAPAPEPEPEPEPEPARASRTFDIRAASARYDFRLVLAEGCAQNALSPDTVCAGPATLFVFQKGEEVELDAIALEEVRVELDARGAPLTNSAELYEIQGTVLSGDFNFDGHEEFAVQIDTSGPYGGPTFDVFLFSAAKKKFVRSEPFSELSRTTLGVFQVDSKRKRLVTSAKSGCCFHAMEELAVVHDVPTPVYRLMRDALHSVPPVEIEEWLVNGKWQRRSRVLPPEQP